jgi:hypothetical protein
MLVHAVPSPASDFIDDDTQPGVVDLIGPAAFRAHDVVVVSALANYVGVFARGQVQALDDTECLEDLERAKHGRAAHVVSTLASFGHEIASGEMPLVTRDQRSERPPRIRESVAGSVQAGNDRRLVHVAGSLPHVRLGLT